MRRDKLGLNTQVWTEHEALYMQGRLCMELLALGTPDVPLNRVRVPRQAATAAKAAIKKDFMEQNRRLGAAPANASPPLQPTPAASDAPVLGASDRVAVKRTASKQITTKPAKVCFTG